jgi:hypothetical protein
MQTQEEFGAVLSTLMESVEKFQAGEAGEGNYLVAMNCLRSLHGFKNNIGNDESGRLRNMIDDYEVDILSLQDEVNELREWKCAMSILHDQPEWCKRCGTWAQEEEKIRATEKYGYICLSCRDDLDCLSPEEIEDARIERERREEYMREHPEEE